MGSNTIDHINMINWDSQTVFLTLNPVTTATTFFFFFKSAMVTPSHSIVCSYPTVWLHKHDSKHTCQVKHVIAGPWNSLHCIKFCRQFPYALLHGTVHSGDWFIHRRLTWLSISPGLTQELFRTNFIFPGTNVMSVSCVLVYVHTRSRNKNFNCSLCI